MTLMHNDAMSNFALIDKCVCITYKYTTDDAVLQRDQHQQLAHQAVRGPVATEQVPRHVRPGDA